MKSLKNQLLNEYKKFLKPIKTHRDVGDKLMVILPTFTLYTTKYKKNFMIIYLYNIFIIKLLKNITKIPRPDNTDSLRFPSGHAAKCFLASLYYLKYNNPKSYTGYTMLLLSIYVGWTRINAKRHKLVDIIVSYIIMKILLKNNSI